MKLERQTFPLAKLVEEIIELFQFVSEEKQIMLTANIPPGLQVVADRNRLRQVLVNLLDNAIKYTPSGGHVEISAQTCGGEVVITVKDTGAGIPADEIPRIWERLYRGDKSRSQRGLGLGLSLVRAIVNAHGGRIELQSDVGKGSSFTIHLANH
jgi:signal transduction histidine kinase